MLPPTPSLRKNLDQNSPFFRSRDYQDDEWKKNDQQIPPEHPVRIDSSLVDQLDLVPLFHLYQNSKRSPLNPHTLLKLVLYEMQQGNIWIKQHLCLKRFFGRSDNAVRLQI